MTCDHTCQHCGNADGTVGHYSDGDYCPGCREALGLEPEPEDVWAESDE